MMVLSQEMVLSWGEMMGRSYGMWFVYFPSPQMTIQEVMTENETEGALRLTYEQKNFSFSISRKKDQQG